MYENNNNSVNHPDPFAGQYPRPPPPPPSQDDHQVFSQPQQQEYLPLQTSFAPSQPMQHETYTPPQELLQQRYQDTYVPPQPMHLQEAYTPPQMRPEVYNSSTPPAVNEYYSQPYYHNMVDEERNVQGINHYQHNEQPLDEYLRQERHEYLKHELPTKQNQMMIPQYNKEEYDEPEKTPMVQEPILSKKERKKLKKQQDEYQPYIVKPTLAPENEAESYKYRPQVHEKKGGCNCCCYNPAITCCSFFCLLISIAFLAAGIALMIASKVVTDKCNNQCSNVVDQAQAACGTICSKVLHDGMFYGGIVVASLAGIAIIWKLIMWTCAGYSKR